MHGKIFDLTKSILENHSRSKSVTLAKCSCNLDFLFLHKYL